MAAVPLNYSLGSLLVRKATNLAVVLGIALVVFVLAGVIMLTAGIRRAFASHGRDDVAAVLANGANFELDSTFDQDVVRELRAAPSVRADAGGPLVAPETLFVALLRKIDGAYGQVALRGVTEASARIRPNFRYLGGHAPRAGTNETAVGKMLVGRFSDLAVGKSIVLRPGRELTVVGVFEDGGSTSESEVWADLDTLRDDFGRTGVINVAYVALTSAGAFDSFRDAVQHDKRLGVRVWREKAFRDHVAASQTDLLLTLGSLISFFFGLGATLGAMNTMYGAVASRGREVGTLRALGFSRRSILWCFVVESVLLTLVGGVLGTLAALPLTFIHYSTMSANWSEAVFSFQLTPSVFLVALSVAAAMGLLGGVLPALRASSISPVTAMRQ